MFFSDCLDGMNIYFDDCISSNRTISEEGSLDIFVNMALENGAAVLLNYSVNEVDVVITMHGSGGVSNVTNEHTLWNKPVVTFDWLILSDKRNRRMKLPHFTPCQDASDVRRLIELISRDHATTDNPALQSMKGDISQMEDLQLSFAERRRVLDQCKKPLLSRLNNSLQQQLSDIRGNMDDTCRWIMNDMLLVLSMAQSLTPDMDFDLIMLSAFSTRNGIIGEHLIPRSDDLFLDATTNDATLMMMYCPLQYYLNWGDTNSNKGATFLSTGLKFYPGVNRFLPDPTYTPTETDQLRMDNCLKVCIYHLQYYYIWF